VALAIRRRSWAVLYVGDEPEQRSLFKYGSLMQIACIGGLFNILNGFLIVYASEPTRTPPLIQVRMLVASPLVCDPFVHPTSGALHAGHSAECCGHFFNTV
jgi:hypothetical protein